MSKAAPLLPTLQPVDHASAQGAQKEILDKVLKQMGMIPNMYRGMANAPAVLSTYLHGYALFRSEAGFTSAEQEVVFLAISQVNGCSYCMAAHSMLADKMSGVPPEVLQAIRAGQPIPDARLSALYKLAQEMVRTHGLPSRQALDAFLSAGYDEVKVLYLVLAIAVKTLSNFSNHALATPLDARFASYAVD
jgi:uncharacterized peroxidase-related enzyme